MASKTDIGMMMAALSAAVQEGKITTREAREVRTKLGVFQSTFTRKQDSKAKKKLKRKIAAKSRKINSRNNSAKGQKRTGGSW